MRALHSSARPAVAPPQPSPGPTATVADGAAPGPAPVGGSAADELTESDLEAVVGGLARTWTDALRFSRHQA